MFPFARQQICQGATSGRLDMHHSPDCIARFAREQTEDRVCTSLMSCDNAVRSLPCPRRLRCILFRVRLRRSPGFLTRHTRNQRRLRVWPCHFPATGDSESTSSCLSLNPYCDDPAASLIHILLLAAHLGESLFCIVEWSRVNKSWYVLAT